MFKRSCLLVLLMLLLTSFAYTVEREEATIQPIKKLKEASLLNADYWHLAGVDSLTRTRLQVYYLYGFLDAHSLWQTKSPEIKTFSENCKGMNMSELLDMMNDLYNSNPDMQMVKPALMLSMWVQAVKKEMDKR
ncbi:MAG: hypothetical protein GTO24_18385 [candidate division Zixibacteria bacterium]|nr:hypothetical protein [candidate division Zixibacteria bacterium]